MTAPLKRRWFRFSLRTMFVWTFWLATMMSVPRMCLGSTKRFLRRPFSGRRFEHVGMLSEFVWFQSSAKTAGSMICGAQDTCGLTQEDCGEFPA